MDALNASDTAASHPKASTSGEHSEQVSTRQKCKSIDSSIILNDEEMKYRLKLYPEPSKVLKDKVRCTACGTLLLNHVKKGLGLHFHPLLQVLLCQEESDEETLAFAREAADAVMRLITRLRKKGIVEWPAESLVRPLKITLNLKATDGEPTSPGDSATPSSSSGVSSALSPHRQPPLPGSVNSWDTPVVCEKHRMQHSRERSARESSGGGGGATQQTDEEDRHPTSAQVRVGRGGEFDVASNQPTTDRSRVVSWKNISSDPFRPAAASTPRQSPEGVRDVSPCEGQFPPQPGAMMPVVEMPRGPMRMDECDLTASNARECAERGVTSDLAQETANAVMLLISELLRHVVVDHPQSMVVAEEMRVLQLKDGSRLDEPVPDPSDQLNWTDVDHEPFFPTATSTPNRFVSPESPRSGPRYARPILSQSPDTMSPFEVSSGSYEVDKYEFNFDQPTTDRSEQGSWEDVNTFSPVFTSTRYQSRIELAGGVRNGSRYGGQLPPHSPALTPAVEIPNSPLRRDEHKLNQVSWPRVIYEDYQKCVSQRSSDRYAAAMERIGTAIQSSGTASPYEGRYEEQENSVLSNATDDGFFPDSLETMDRHHSKFCKKHHRLSRKFSNNKSKLDEDLFSWKF